jgi:hypothetical protein
MHVEAPKQSLHLFAEAENKILLWFVNVKQEKYDSSSEQVKSIGFSVLKIWCSPQKKNYVVICTSARAL